MSGDWNVQSFLTAGRFAFFWRSRLLSWHSICIGRVAGFAFCPAWKVTKGTKLGLISSVKTLFIGVCGFLRGEFCHEIVRMRLSGQNLLSSDSGGRNSF